MKLMSKIKNARKRISSHWAIEPRSFADIVKIYETFEKNPRNFLIEMNVISEKSDEKDPTADMGSIFDFEPQNLLSVDGSVATISVKGPLVDENDCISAYFGCTSYKEIQTAIEDVEKMESVERVIFDIDSPGGMVAGVDNAAIAIKSMKKKTEAHVGIMAASAAYWLASQCDEIIATCATAQFGSIGVVVEYWDSSRAMENIGYDKICIVSSGAPDKRVDAKTDEGRRKIKSGLDDIENIFFRRVADGRGVSTSYVGAKFGQGGMFLAEKSLKVGMIDRADFVLKNNNNSKSKTENPMETKMNLKEFLTENPESQKEIDARIKEAVDKAVLEEKNATSKKVDKASAILNADYSKAVKNLAVQVIKGEKSLDTLETIVSFEDQKEEEANSDAAKKETDNMKETPAEKVPSKSTDGKVKDEDSYQDALTRAKNLRK